MASEQECRLLISESETFQALDLRITATPFEIERTHFVVLAINDISHEKRRKMLERVFFHDVMNLAGGIAGLLELMKTSEDGNIEQMIDMSAGNIHDLMEEVSMQRDLHAAELNELKCSYSVVSSVHTLIQMISVYQAHPACDKRVIKLSSKAEIFNLNCDPVLLKRILGNLIKNAAEASQAGENVTVACWTEAEQAIFTVHNASVMPTDIKHQIFQRSFSTKGADRGLGTYSVKLFAEKYLHGTVSFDSIMGEGTTFKVTLPIHGREVRPSNSTVP